MGRGRFNHLKTPRLSLVPPAEVDADAIATAAGDFEVSRWLTRVPHPYTRADALDFQRSSVGKEGSVWTALDSDGVAGGVSVDPELGYWIARRAWGRGYATEISCAVIDVWFSDPAAGLLVSGHFEANARSRRILDRLGFRPVGSVEQDSLSLGRPVIVQRMVLDRGDWERARLRITQN